jgi:PTS system N-acetylgalactosamine-specific IIA component
VKYVVLVSHGDFATGLKTSLDMLAGKRDDVIAVGLPDGKTADEFALMFKESIQAVTGDDEIILLADIIGGSPLTTALNVLANEGKLANTITFGGMNLPLALTSVLMKDSSDRETFVATVVSEAKEALQEFKLEQQEDDEI